MVEEISGMLALHPDEEVERASRCHGHQQKVIASRHEFDTCPVTSTSSPGTSLKFRDFSFVSNGLWELLLSAGVSRS